MKFCKDCFFYSHMGMDLPRCTKTDFQDPVTGEHRMFYCSVERQSLTGCGTDARFFEEKTPCPSR